MRRGGIEPSGPSAAERNILLRKKRKSAVGKNLTTVGDEAGASRAAPAPFAGPARPGAFLLLLPLLFWLQGSSPLLVLVDNKRFGFIPPLVFSITSPGVVATCRAWFANLQVQGEVVGCGIGRDFELQREVAWEKWDLGCSCAKD